MGHRRSRSRSSSVIRRAARWFAVTTALLVSLAGTTTSGLADPASELARYREEVEQRRAFVVSTYGRAPNTRLHPKWYPYYVLARTRVAGCEPKLSEYMGGVYERGQVQASGVSEPEMFSEPPLVRFLNLHGDCLNAAQLDQISRALARPRAFHPWHDQSRRDAEHLDLPPGSGLSECGLDGPGRQTL